MELLGRIQTYLKRSGISKSRFGRDVLNDPGFVRDLLHGREPKIRTERRVNAWLDAQEGAAR